MATQTTSGKAFEFALLLALKQVLLENGACQLVENTASLSAEKEYMSLTAEQQAELCRAAIPAIKHLLHLEPALARNGEFILPLFLSLQSDQAGAEGDVRDVIVSNPAGWQIGISAKHQHEAVKHSRISHKIDFGEKWLGIPCSPDYFSEIMPVFRRLQTLKGSNALWSDVTDKEATIYAALLRAFRRELLRIDKENPGRVAAELACYLIGRKDYYKIMKLQNMSKVQVFNFNGTLNTSYAGAKPLMHLDRLKLPRRIVELDFKIEESGAMSDTTLDLICDGGWQISFRIHNASSKVEPSLKFDIGLTGRPNSLPTFHVLWE